MIVPLILTFPHSAREAWHQTRGGNMGKVYMPRLRLKTDSKSGDRWDTLCQKSRETGGVESGSHFLARP